MLTYTTIWPREKDVSFMIYRNGPRKQEPVGRDCHGYATLVLELGFFLRNVSIAGMEWM